MTHLLLLLVLLAFVASLVGTELVRRHSLRNGVLDIPNHRSSHQQPTPRGGGVAFVLCFLGSAAIVFFYSSFDMLWLAFCAGFVMVAFIGYWDDRQALSVRLRLLVHLLASTVLVNAAGLATPSLPFVATEVPASVWFLLQVMFVIWFINLTNFMDGIDGIAGVQAIGALAGFAILWCFSGGSLLDVWPVAVLAATVLGFLFLNFPPARIFMGDAGSGALGFAFGGFTLVYFKTDPNWAIAWLILLAVFCTDATFTLLVRCAQRQKFGQAHRSHAYQIAARRFKSHRPVTLAVAVIVTFWLLPWAAAVTLLGLNAWFALFFAYLPLVCTAAWLKAGKQND